MRHFAVSGVGGDRPGIVAAVTAALAGLDCNLEDTSMTVLSGRFAMVLLVAGADSLDAPRVEQALRGPAAALDLAVWVHDVEEAVPGAPPGESWTVSVHGADRAGMVSGLAGVLAGAGVNIVDLSTRLVGGDRPVYAMLLEVVVPPGLDPAVLSERMGQAASELGVAISMHPADADIF